jgi:hypothetical protein
MYLASFLSPFSQLKELKFHLIGTYFSLNKSFFEPCLGYKPKIMFFSYLGTLMCLLQQILANESWLSVCVFPSAWVRKPTYIKITSGWDVFENKRGLVYLSDFDMCVLSLQIYYILREIKILVQ